MDIAIIAPVDYLKDYCSITNFNLCYADVYRTSKEYSRFYKTRRKEEKTVVLDSSSKLPRKPIKEFEFLEVVEDLKPTYVVLPDIDFSWEKTVSLAEYYLDKIDSRIKLIVNLQGKDSDTVYKCYSKIKNYANMIGAPSSLEKISDRNFLIGELGINKESILFLEIYKNPRIEIPGLPNIAGIATSYPVRLGLDLRTLTEQYPTPPSLDFFTKKNPMPELVAENIYNYLDYCGVTGC